MSQKRKQYSAEFKAKVALAALKEIRVIGQLTVERDFLSRKLGH